MLLHASTNNLADTVLTLFDEAVANNDNLWPSRIRVDHGVENLLVCDAMVRIRGEGRLLVSASRELQDMTKGNPGFRPLATAQI